MANKTQKIMFVAVAITMIAAAFIAGVEVQKSTGPVPADIVIVGINADGDMIQSDIQPITRESRIVFPASEEVVEYHLTYGH